MHGKRPRPSRRSAPQDEGYVNINISRIFRMKPRRFKLLSETAPVAYYPPTVSSNRTTSPCDGASSEPSHITTLPRTTVPMGHPVTCLPS